MRPRKTHLGPTVTPLTSFEYIQESSQVIGHRFRLLSIQYDEREEIL